LAKTSISTPPPEAVLVADGKNLAEEKEVPSGAHEDTGYAPLSRYNHLPLLCATLYSN
jgi:hypothetical protein